jgi:hypothetical protein
MAGELFGAHGQLGPRACCWLPLPHCAGLPTLNTTISYCPGNLTSSCYFFNDTLQTHTEAKASCSAFGGTGALVSYSSAEEQVMEIHFNLKLSMCCKATQRC